MSVEVYVWVKAFHIVAVISWMAGLLYLPRLFVYHAEVPAGSERARMLAIMERRLLRAIMTPAMIATIGAGAWLAAIPGVVDGAAGWFMLKLVGVAGLAAVHGLCARWRRAFADGRNQHSPRFYRLVNEVPTVLMIAIVILVVVKPF